MATHSSVLAWRIPGTGEPGGLPSMGSHRVGHDWSGLAAAAVADQYQGFPGSSAIKNPPAMQESQETQVRSMGQKNPLEEGMATHSSILARKKNLMDRGAWQATVHGVTKSRTQLSTYAVKLMWFLFSLSPVQSESHQMTEYLVMMLQLTCCVTFDKSVLFVEPWLFFPLKMKGVYQTRNWNCFFLLLAHTYGRHS